MSDLLCAAWVLLYVFAVWRTYHQLAGVKR